MEKTFLPLSKKFLIAILMSAFAVSCGDQKPAHEDQKGENQPAAAPTKSEPKYGAATLEEFRSKLEEAFTERNFEIYRNLHCVEKLPPLLVNAMNGAVKHKTLQIFEYQSPKIEIEPLTERDLEVESQRPWNLPPTSWVIVRGASPQEFSHWAIGEFEGRYYFASRTN